MRRGRTLPAPGTPPRAPRECRPPPRRRVPRAAPARGFRGRFRPHARVFGILAGMSENRRHNRRRPRGERGGAQLATRGFSVCGLWRRARSCPRRCTEAPTRRSSCAPIRSRRRSPKARQACSRPSFPPSGRTSFAAALRHAVPAGGRARRGPLGVLGDVTALLEAHPNVCFERAEARSVEDAAAQADAVVVAAGPLATEALAASLARLAGREALGVLRRGRAHRHGRLAGLLEGLSPKPLRRRRGETTSMPRSRPGRIRRVRPRAGFPPTASCGEISSRTTCSGVPAHRGR